MSDLEGALPVVSRMAAFLLRLAENPEPFAEFKRDPGAMMPDSGPSDDERSALMSNDGTAFAKRSHHPLTSHRS